MFLKLIHDSNYFDREWYSNKYPDVVISGLTPVMHYFLIGASLNRDPGPNFDAKKYVIDNPDIKQPAFFHFLSEAAKKNNIVVNIEPLINEKDIESDIKVSGDLNLENGGDPIVRGWIAVIGSNLPRIAKIYINGQFVDEVVAKNFRDDLKINRINDGNHAFELAVPIELIQGEEFDVELRDGASSKIISTKKVFWKISRRFTNFDGFLAESLVNPYLSAPFREEDKAAFAVMENIADWLHEQADVIDNPPLVSVIMPSYNRITTIKNAVSSVLKQKYINFELIIVDDGSTDGTLEWCKTCDDKRVTVVSLEKNSGVSFARNTGIKVAKGKYLMYLDSDNDWDPRYVGSMVGAFTINPKVDALYSGQIIFKGQSTAPSAIRFGSYNKSLLFNNNYIDVNAFCSTRESMIEQGCFDENIKRYEDWDLFVRYAENCEMLSVPVLLSNYYLFKTENSLTGIKSYEKFLHQVRRKNANERFIDNESYLIHRIKKCTHPLFKKISIIIPSFQSLDDLSSCIEALLSLRGERDIQIIVVDNCSDNDVVEYIERMSGNGLIKSILNKENYGFTFAVNQGISISEPTSDIILLNNDAIFTEDAFEWLQQAAYSDPSCGMVVPQQILPGGTDTINTHVPYANSKHSCDVNLSKHHNNIINPKVFHDGGISEICFAAFFCVYIKREVIEKSGLLDAEFGRHYRSDRMYCDFARNINKYKIFHQPNARVFHKLQQSTKHLAKNSIDKNNDSFDLMFKKNQWDRSSKDKLGYRTALWDI